jgi:hypothetical protein
MGQAKQRGTKEQRIAEALERNEQEAAIKAEVFRKRQIERELLYQEAQIKREAQGLNRTPRPRRRLPALGIAAAVGLVLAAYDKS